jgi:hypothetical protein
MHFRVGANDVVVRENVGKAKLLHSLRVRTHAADVATDLGLREHDADSHVRFLTSSPP